MHTMKCSYFPMIFNVFSKIEIKIVIQLNLSSYTAIINAIQTAVIGSLHWKTENEFHLKQTKIKLCSVVTYYRFLSLDLSKILINVECSVNGFYLIIIINYGTTYNLSFWHHTIKYINVLNYALQFRPGILSDL